MSDTSKPLNPNELGPFWCIEKRTKDERARSENGKTCTKCGVWKPLDDFHQMDNPNAIAGRASRCRDCRNRTDWHKAIHKGWMK